MRRLITLPALLAVLYSPVFAQTEQTSEIDGSNIPIAASPVQEHCITIMSGFPNNGHVPRYQFFKLTQELARDVTPTLRSAIDYFGDSSITSEIPVKDVVENIANPVYRQAAPEITIGNMGYLIDFALDCEAYLSGQIESLEAFDDSLHSAEFHTVIGEDALFMRQILSDSLFRLDAGDHEIFGPSVQTYSETLITRRDEIEFTSFEAQLEEIEMVYMTDLDGRLARSNDVINESMDQESFIAAIETVDDLNSQARLKRKETMLRTLARILGAR